MSEAKKSTTNMKDKNIVMVVYAYNPLDPTMPWIYGVYTNRDEGFAIQEKMQEECPHLIWNNNLLKLK